MVDRCVARPTTVPGRTQSTPHRTIDACVAALQYYKQLLSSCNVLEYSVSIERE